MHKKNIVKLTVGSFSTNCWIYPTGKTPAEKEVIIIDPGDEADKIIFHLKKLDLTPKYILLTHGHFDHTGGVSEIYLCCGKPQIAIHRLDAGHLGPNAYNAHSNDIKTLFGNASFLDVYWNEMPQGAIPPADILLEEGSEIGPFTVLHLSGHTPGSIAFWDKEQNVLFTGDTLFANGCGRTDLPGGNQTELLASLKRLLKMDGSIKVYPGHGEITTIGKEAVHLPC
ncbi:MAG: MBL fold metallo-hydrolase [Treponema sp.]|jgi:glyoxylase-like metal-dependent hydrolase (beta-lactamase superfamily II)|nr:MBL fold metallo-hydrolase [Treponema sp.]